MKSVIFNAFYSKDRKAKGPNIKGTLNQYDNYIRNIFVSLKSAKLKNPKSDVVLITNAKVGDKYDKLFKENGIKILIVDFDTFVMPDCFKWSYAFYKLNALYHILKKTDYDSFLELDTDTYVVRSLEDLWKECYFDNVLLYDTRHSYSHKVRQQINTDYRKNFGKMCNIEHYGGEFICGNRKALMILIDKCLEIYDIFKSNHFNVDEEIGDETIISIAAAITNLEIISANPYIERFWTRKFYLTSTIWVNDPVSIWHLPAEKSYGIMDLYDYFQNHGYFPSIEKAARICNLPNKHKLFNISMFRFATKNILKSNKSMFVRK